MQRLCLPLCLLGSACGSRTVIAPEPLRAPGRIEAERATALGQQLSTKNAESTDPSIEPPPLEPAIPAPPPLAEGVVDPHPSPQTRTIRVHVSAPDDNLFGDCRAHRWVTRTVPPRVDPVEFAMDELFRGPTPFEKQHGLRAAFGDPTNRGVLQRESVSVTVTEFGTAVVELSHPHGTPCQVERLESFFEFTLKQFVGINAVLFPGSVDIDG